MRRRVNFAGLDVEELGSVYESLLDYHPHVTAERRNFELIAGSERKSTGSYYTPPELVARADQERAGAGDRGPARQGGDARGQGARPPVAENLRPGRPAPAISCSPRPAASGASLRACAPARPSRIRRLIARRCATSSAAASMRWTRIRSPSISARSRCGSRATAKACRSPSSIITSSAATA